MKRIILAAALILTATTADATVAVQHSFWTRQVSAIVDLPDATWLITIDVDTAEASAAIVEHHGGRTFVTCYVAWDREYRDVANHVTGLRGLMDADVPTDARLVFTCAHAAPCIAEDWVACGQGASSWSQPWTTTLPAVLFMEPDIWHDPRVDERYRR